MDTQSSRKDEGVAEQNAKKDTLTYEETPPIEPIKEEPDIFPPPKPKNNIASILTTIIFLILLFIIGFWLSGFIRTFIGNFYGGNKQENTTPTPTTKESTGIITPTIELTPFGTWKTYPVLNGRTRETYEGISYKLPSDVLTPVCDGTTCRSQGTYLPGGTRFTVALRGDGQVLPDYRGKIISDLKGIPFTIKETVIGGNTATEFEGSFIGTTVSGYVFTQMHGFMIPVTDVISLEINHFSPNGLTTDFTQDDILFSQILETLTIPMSVMEKGGVSTPSSELPTATPTQTPSQGSPSATPIIGD